MRRMSKFGWIPTTLRCVKASNDIRPLELPIPLSPLPLYPPSLVALHVQVYGRRNERRGNEGWMKHPRENKNEGRQFYQPYRSIAPEIGELSERGIKICRTETRNLASSGSPGIRSSSFTRLPMSSSHVIHAVIDAGTARLDLRQPLFTNRPIALEHVGCKRNWLVPAIRNRLVDGANADHRKNRAEDFFLPRRRKSRRRTAQ